MLINNSSCKLSRRKKIPHRRRTPEEVSAGILLKKIRSDQEFGIKVAMKAYGIPAPPPVFCIVATDIFNTRKPVDMCKFCKPQPSL